MKGSLLIVLSAISIASCQSFGSWDSGTLGSGTNGTWASGTWGSGSNGSFGSNCQSHWIADGYCDDLNNNFECAFDGGDCCNNYMEGWSNYCQECECKESTWGSGTNGTWGSGTWGSGTFGSGTW